MPERLSQKRLAKVVLDEGILQLTKTVRCQLDRNVEYLRPNPKRAGSKSAKRYAKYMIAKTIREALQLGAFPDDLKFDYAAKHLRLVSGGRSANAKLPSCVRLPPKDGPELGHKNAAQMMIEKTSCWVPFSLPIKFAPNPKAKSSLAYKRYAKFEGAKTVGEALKRGAAVGDITWGLGHGQISCPGGLVAEPVGQVAVASADRARFDRRLSALRARAKTLSKRYAGVAKRQLKELRKAVDARRSATQKHLMQVSAGNPNPKRQRVTPLPHKRVSDVGSDYVIVIPSFPHDKRVKTLKSHTLALLERQGIPTRRIKIVVASHAEKKLYAKSLGGQVSQILVARQGIVEVREWIVRHYPEGQHVLSIDDDVSDLCWRPEGATKLVSLPVGGLDRLVSTAMFLMKQEGAYLWSLSPCCADERKVCSRADHVSRCLGLANGSFYGFLNRPSCKALLPCLGSAAEDCERSVRFFQKDKVIIRFLGYTAVTKPFQNVGGILEDFSSVAERKEREVEHIEALQEAFPALVKLEPKLSLETLVSKFTAVGLGPLKPEGLGGWA